MSWIARCRPVLQVINQQVRWNGTTPTVLIAAKHPFKFSCEADKLYAWCFCGRSKKQPLCDGSHKGTGLRPVRIKLDKAKDVMFCGCKQTKNAPYCDGSHKSDSVQSAQI
ncbi:CDGSH iron-sulfur domain-containing protein 3, mitochondrial-like [Glandiceps talaboti]